MVKRMYESSLLKGAMVHYKKTLNLITKNSELITESFHWEFPDINNLRNMG